MIPIYLYMPRIGYLEQALRIPGYPKLHPKRELVFDPAHPAINDNRFQDCDWAEFFRDSIEAIPGNKTFPRFNCMLTHLFVDANHSGYTNMRQFQTGILLFSNRVTIIWFSKRHYSLEASKFIFEFTGINNAVYIIEALCCKLCVFGVQINEPTNIFCYNRGIRTNRKRPE